MKSFHHSFYDEYLNKLVIRIDDEGFSDIKLMKKFGLNYDLRCSLNEQAKIINDSLNEKTKIKFYSLENIEESINRAVKENNYNSFQLLNIDNDNFFMSSDKLLVEMYQLSKLLSAALSNPNIKYISYKYY